MARIPSKANYLQMMKNLENQNSMGQGSVSDRGMNPTGNDMVGMSNLMTDPKLKGLNIPPMETKDLMDSINKSLMPNMRDSGSGSTSDDEMKAIENAISGAMTAEMGLGAISDAEFQMIEKAMGPLTDETKKTLQALLSMGVSMDDALDAIGNDMSNPETMTEGAISDKEMGALKGLPSDETMREKGSVSDYERSLGKDRTYSDDMYKQINT